MKLDPDPDEDNHLNQDPDPDCRLCYRINNLPLQDFLGKKHLKGLSHEMDLAFDDMYG